MPLAKDIRTIREAAIQAPSGENAQPWSFRVSGTTIELYNLPDRDRSVYNWDQRGSYVAHGALLENLTVAAQAQGYNAQVNLFPEGTQSNLVARIELTQVGTVTEITEPLYSFIAKRKTNRKPYKTTQITQAQRSEILSAQRTTDQAEMRLIENSEQIKTLARVGSSNEEVMLSNEGLHNFFFSHITWTKKEDDEKKIGFYIKTLELQPPAEMMFKLIKNWSVMKIFNILGFPKIVGTQNAAINAQCAAIGGIFIDNINPEAYIAAGRLLERTWLIVTKLGISLQPLAGLLFMHLSLSQGDTTRFTEKNSQIIKEQYSKVRGVFNIQNKIPVLMFRIGDGGEPSAQATRFRLEQILSQKT